MRSDRDFEGWDPSLETGDERVDSDHKALLRLASELRIAAARDDDTYTSSAGNRLNAYLSAHFSWEQELMMRIGYPPGAMIEHVAEHAKLMARTRKIATDREAGPSSPAATAGFLQLWVRDHVHRCDRMLVEHARTAHPGS